MPADEGDAREGGPRDRGESNPGESDPGELDSDEPAKADHYRHGDGTDEIVFAVEDGHVLTIREYRSVRDFERAVEDAEYVGVHDGVADLPNANAFEDGERE